MTDAISPLHWKIINILNTGFTSTYLWQMTVNNFNFQTYIWQCIAELAAGQYYYHSVSEVNKWVVTSGGDVLYIYKHRDTAMFSRGPEPEYGQYSEFTIFIELREECTW